MSVRVKVDNTVVRLFPTRERAKVIAESYTKFFPGEQYKAVAVEIGWLIKAVKSGAYYDAIGCLLPEVAEKLVK